MVGVRGSIPLAPTIPGSSGRLIFARVFGDRRARRGVRSSRPDPSTDCIIVIADDGAHRRETIESRPGALQPCRRTGASRVAGGRADAADPQGAIKDKHGDWETRCETPPGASYEQCAIVLSVVDQDRPNLTMVVIVLNTADRKARLMRVIAPLGVLLPPGVGLQIDDQDLGHLNFLQCLANGCIAQVALDDKLLDKLKTGKTATLGVFQTPEQGVGVLAPLAGFKEAYEQLP